MTPDRFKVVVLPNSDDDTFLVFLEVWNFPDKTQADAFAAQLSQWVANTDNHDGR